MWILWIVLLFIGESTIHGELDVLHKFKALQLCMAANCLFQ